MFRIGLKFPYHGLPRLSRHNPSRLYLAPRNYANSSDPSKGRSKGGTGFKYTVGTLTVATAATVAYAAYDKDFRKWLGDNVPYSEEFLKVLLQEDTTYLGQLQSYYEKVKSSIYDGLFGSPSKIDHKSEQQEKVKLDISKTEVQPKDFKPPKPVFPAVAEQDECPDKAWKEIRVIPEKGGGSGEPQVVAEIDKPAAETDKKSLPESHPKNLVDLESKISASAVAAIAAFSEATSSIRDYSRNIYLVVEHSTEHLEQDVWDQVKELVARKDEAVKKAEKAANEALEGIEKMKNLLKTGIANVSTDVVDKANRNIERILSAVEEAKSELEIEKKKSRITETYWNKVEEARKFFEEELKILFPGIKISEKDLKVGENELDLFILYAVQTVLYFQKELKKLEILGEERLKDAINKADDAVLVKAKVESELEKEYRELEQQFQKRALQLRAEAETEVRLQLRRQAQAHSDHLADVLSVKEAEMERELRRLQDERMAKEQTQYKMQLSAMLGRMRGIDDALRARADNDKHARQAQLLWSACQSLHRSLKNTSPGVPWQQQLKPLKEVIDNVSKAATAEDELVNVVLTGIPAEARDRGVYTEEAMRERFLKVEQLARRLALVPDQGGSLPLYMLSYLQSFLLIKAVNPLPAAELADEPVDVSQLNTYDILERARYWMDRGDFGMTLRYMNQLKGASRCVARDWMNEVRILLETQQAANTLMAHAASSGLLYV
ncbi:MICOS complex subunit Mic60 [Blattella germanica]|nr:MICOS complex subunit Mic60 [Blattella germanica]